MVGDLRQFDVVVLGAGAAGLMCAAVAGQRGRRVALLEHGGQAGRKILISGGGRCNFTNVHCGPGNFLSENRHFAKSALAGYGPREFLELVEQYGIRWHDEFGQWDPKNQRPELWNLYNTRIKRGEHIRVFPLSNWTELDVWSYIERQKLEIPSIYYAHQRAVFE